MDGLHVDRSQALDYGELSESTYNLLIGGLLLYGFIANAIICTLFGDLFYYASGATYGLFLIVYLVCVLLSVTLSSSHSALVNFIGYNLLVLPIGVLLSIAVAPMSMMTVRSALIGTGVFVIVMIAASYARPDFFLSMGSTLAFSLIATLVAEVILLLLGIGTGWIDYLVIAIFSMYLGFDWAIANQCPTTARNAILSATQIYLDIVNIFIRLLAILGKRDRR